MNKIVLIIKREFMTRVKKRSFIIMSILGPVLFSAFLLLPAYLTSLEDKEIKTVAVIDSSHIFINQFTGTETIKYQYLNNVDINILQSTFNEFGYYAVLLIHPAIINSPNAAVLYSAETINSSVQENITSNLERIIQLYRLRAYGIEENTLKSSQMHINLRTIKWDKSGKGYETNVELKKSISYIGGFLIYFFIFLFGVQVMRGVIEEKSGRIIEIIASSVKPFQLMIGKIVGIALVALVQFIIWIVLTYSVVNQLNDKWTGQPEIQQKVEMQTGQDLMSSHAVQQNEIVDHDIYKEERFFNKLGNINFPLLIGMFIFFFIGGYLLYGSFFAAIGSAVDSETDVQQFTLPATLPLILSIFVLMNTIQDPNSQLSLIFSLIPLTSPIVMMARIPFDIPVWQIALSAVILVVSFLGSTWLAAKIYRTGILMYGKKISYKELWKWIKYKD